MRLAQVSLALSRRPAADNWHRKVISIIPMNRLCYFYDAR